jgi:ABC-type Mn2+/Zn2+ transport system permease subunit
VIVGLLFTASLAVGILIIPNAEIVESLFGAFPVLSLPFLLVILSTAAVLSVLWLRPRLLLIFAMLVALGIELVGTLLMGALTIIPAAVAKNVSRSMRGYVILSALLGAISVGGMWMADALGLLPGPSIILFGVALFLLSLVAGRKRAA